MPDWWEEIHGFNTNSGAGNFTESNGDPDGDEYTNLEDCLNWMAVPHADCDAGSTVDVDLHALSRGYTNSSPSYAFSNMTHGTATLVNGRYARFAASISGNGLGSFDYTVTDSGGYTMTRTINIRIIGEPAPVLGIRNNAGVLQLEITALVGTSNTVQTPTEPSGWANWTNVVGNGAMQLLPLNDLTNDSARCFRAFSD